MFSYERGLQKEKVWRSLQREKGPPDRLHQLREAAVAEILGHAERAKNEPSYKLPQLGAEVPLNTELMAEIAPGYDVEGLLERLISAPVPLAALKNEPRIKNSKLQKTISLAGPPVECHTDSITPCV